MWSPDNENISEGGEDGVGGDVEGGDGLGGDDLGVEGAWKEVGLLQSLCQSPFQLSARIGSSSSSPITITITILITTSTILITT